MVDRRDHAVTDEEFALRRPEPRGLCGTVLLLAPLTAPNGECCPRCIAVLQAHDRLHNADRRDQSRWCARLLAWLTHRVPQSPVVPSQRAGARDDRIPLPVSAAVFPAAVPTGIQSGPQS